MLDQEHSHMGHGPLQSSAPTPPPVDISQDVPMHLPTEETQARAPGPTRSTTMDVNARSEQVDVPETPSDLLDQGPCEVERDPEGGLWFFLIDAVEDDRASPPRVYLFGKVKVRSGSAEAYRSCCLVVEKLERCFHLLLKVEDPSDYESAKIAANAAAVELETLRKEKFQNLKVIRSKLKYRNYAFEKPLGQALGNLPFLKVVCEAAGSVPPVGLAGDNFTHSFGIQASLLERLLLTRRLMGPSWYRLHPDSFKEEPARLSHCATEFRITPASIQVPKTETEKTQWNSRMPASSPPLRVLSVSLQTFQQTAQLSHEVLAIGCSLHPTVSADASASESDLENSRRTWAAIRRLDANPFPRDADKALAAGGFHSYNNELALLNAFLLKVQEFDPDVIAGHNVFSVDLDVLSSRLHQLKVQNWHRLGRLRRSKDRVPRNEGRQAQGFWAGTSLAAGRLVCDTALQAKDLLPKLGCYDLANLAKEQLGSTDVKIVEPEAIAEYYDSARSLLNLLQLKTVDAYCIARIAHSLQILPLTRQLTCLAGNLWNGSLQNKRAERNELLLCHEFHSKKFVLPDKESLSQKKRRLQIEGGQGISAGFDEPDEPEAQATGSRKGKVAYSGGLVLEPQAGLYDDLVMLLDFNSLYPSIIQEYNICFTTVDRPDENEVAKMTSEAQLLSQTREPDGAEEGILPQVLRRLVDSRRVVKASMKSEKNPKILQMLEIRQKALKLTANSMYGCLGFQNSRFHAKPLAALITAKGREALQSTKTVVQQELQLEVVYGDTDSVFVNSKTADFQKAMHIAEQIKRAVNKRYRRLEIEIDAVFVRLMLLKKKKYAALKVVNWEKKLFEQELKGLDIVRRDWCGLAKEMGEAILTKILDPNMNKEESIEWVHQFLSEQAKKMDDGQVPLDKFVITKGLTKDPKDYPDAKKQPHVQVALRLLSRGKQVRPGQEIGYVVCDTTGEGEGKSLLAERARDPHEMELDPTLCLDMAWYKKHQVHPIIARILGVVEGTSRGRIAECLGMDAAIFAQVVQHEEGEGLDFLSQYMDADPNALFDRSLRYKNFSSILDGVKCKKCGGTTPWQRLLTPSTGEEPKQAPPFTCKDCQAQIQPGVARNQWHRQLRQLVKQHCEGWVQPADQVAGTEKTRRANKGDNLVSEQTVKKELQFAAHLCESAALLTAEEDAALQTALARMKKDADAWMKIGCQHFIDCGQMFGAIFGTPLLGTLHQ
ncbi:POLA [Symbiodinium sp. CCMP2456]|nr:POLA [Symbiodinium sp. CCMP2456]